ncbi:MAG: Histidine kinase, partial [Thermodesulfobacteriota bacterium]|nr:Histidine kinase [Thermodesulfobacteriota bacterium]
MCFPAAEKGNSKKTELKDMIIMPILEELSREVETLALETVMLDAGDITGLGKNIKSIESIRKHLDKINNATLISVADAMIMFIGDVIMGERTDLSPFEKGIALMQTICRDLEGGNEPERDISSLLADLGVKSSSPTGEAGKMNSGRCAEKEGSSGASDNGESREDSAGAKACGKSVVTCQEDIEIISDFVAESLD